MPRNKILFTRVNDEQATASFPNVDALVVFEKQDHSIPTPIPQEILQTLTANNKRGLSEKAKSDTLTLVPTHGLMATPHLIVVGSGMKDALKLGHDLIQLARREKFHSLLIEAHLVSQKKERNLWMRLLSEGMMMANYARQTYHSKSTETSFVSEVYFLHDNIDDEWEEILKRADIISEAVCLARDLTNLPGNYLVPSVLAEEVQTICAAFDCLDCEVLDEHQIASKGMGGLLAVGKASVNQPRMITVTYKGNDESDEVLALIGKGITFDTGGISLKRSDNMAEMICDMAGAATVTALIQAVGRLRPKCNLVFVIASAENMPAGNAYKPGDIITTLSGKTIEVLNTDAEGRVVLADALTYALQKGASRLVDIATLTGAILVCLADVATGAVTNNQEFMNQLLESSIEAEERVWQLPVYPEYKEMIKSTVADVKNTGGRYAGSITAGLFIGTFAEHTPWIHLDVAGTAFLDKQRGINPKGGTGVMVRTLLNLIENQ
jgi:leucyl aminopeptidase